MCSSQTRLCNFHLVYFAHFKYASSVVCCSGYLSYNQIIKIKKTHHQLYFIFNNHIIYILLLPSTGSWKNVGISHTKAIYIFVTTYSKRTISPSNLVLSTSNMVMVISFKEFPFNSSYISCVFLYGDLHIIRAFLKELFPFLT